MAGSTKNHARTSRSLPWILLLIGGGLVVGCSSSTMALEEGERASISWLTKHLQHDGIYVRERGSAFLSVPSEESARLILDNKDVLDAYEFASKDIATSQAYELAGLYPRNDVFLKDALVVVRFTTRDTGLLHTLVGLLGTAI